MKGYFSLVLHTHMPYVRKNGVWPVGEDWLYQAMSETYIPLLGALAQLEGEGVGPCLALTLTPVLCEQLADPYIQEQFVAHLKTMSEHTRKDIDDFTYFDDEARKALAELRTELAAAQEGYNQASNSFKAGTGTSLETLIAQDQLLRAQVQLASQEFEYKVAYLTLIRVVGTLDINGVS